MAAGENMWDLAWVTDPAAWAGLGTLVLLEVVLGVYALYANFVRPALWNAVYAYDLTWLQWLLDSLSTLVVAVLLVVLGVYLLKGGPARQNPDEDYTAFKGGEKQ